MALASVTVAVSSDAADLLIAWGLVQQLRQHGRIADATADELNLPDFQFFLVDAEVNLAPDAAFQASMLTGIPLSFAFDLDAG